jgi:hypothetical protein
MLVIAMIVLLYFMVHDYFALELANQRISDSVYLLSIRMSLWSFLFGVLTEWKGLGKLLNKEIHFNWKLFIPAIIVSIISFIPNVYWLNWYGSPMPIPEHFFFNIFVIPETHMVVSVLAGIMFIRSFVKR